MKIQPIIKVNIQYEFNAHQHTHDTNDNRFDFKFPNQAYMWRVTSVNGLDLLTSSRGYAAMLGRIKGITAKPYIRIVR